MILWHPLPLAINISPFHLPEYFPNILQVANLFLGLILSGVAFEPLLSKPSQISLKRNPSYGLKLLMYIGINRVLQTGRWLDA